MIAFLVSLALMLGTWGILKDGLIRGQRLRLAGIDANALGMTAVAVLAAMWFFGVVYGVMLVLAIALHEYGHVLAYRICGRREASFVLMPLFGAMTSAAPVWNQAPPSALRPCVWRCRGRICWRTTGFRAPTGFSPLA